jgi:hypothetical protein
MDDEESNMNDENLWAVASDQSSKHARWLVYRPTLQAYN